MTTKMPLTISEEEKRKFASKIIAAKGRWLSSFFPTNELCFLSDSEPYRVLMLDSAYVELSHVKRQYHQLCKLFHPGLILLSSFSFRFANGLQN
jgi:hypothetical protein